MGVRACDRRHKCALSLPGTHSAVVVARFDVVARVTVAVAVERNLQFGIAKGCVRWFVANPTGELALGRACLT